jgi:hypothetical protein
MSKISTELIRYAISRKQRNPSLSVRTIAEEASDRYQTRVSKSSINKILMGEKLSSPRGRSVSKIFRPCLEADGVGFSFLFGASKLLDMSGAIARTVRKLNPFLRLKPETIETISEAWLMSKAVYNTSLEKVVDYSKKDLWNLIGKKVSRGSLKSYLGSLNMLQLFNSHIFSELSMQLQDVHLTKITMSDKTFFLVDGRFYGLWDQKAMPFSFSTTVEFTNSYINSFVLNNEPLVIFNVKTEGVLDKTLTDFVFSLSGSAPEKRIVKIEMISPKSVVVKEVPFIVPGRRKFCIGIWPWQYKLISEIEKRGATGSFYLDSMGENYPFVEDEIRFSQHIHNNEVRLRMVVIKNAENGSARIGILTNIDKTEMTAKQVVGLFARRWNNFEETRDRITRALKRPPYLEDFVLSERIMEFAKRILAAEGPDESFGILVEILHIFSQRSFFPSDVNGWSLLKMRELFYKSQGLIKRDMGDDIIFKLLKLNDLQHISVLKEAAGRFNEMSIVEKPDRKLWIDASKLA